MYTAFNILVTLKRTYNYNLHVLVRVNFYPNLTRMYHKYDFTSKE